MSGDGSTEMLASHYLWVVMGPILIIFGTVGNLLCIAVMCRSSLRSSNASVYLIALAVADTCVLYTGLLRQVVNEVTSIDLRDNSNVSCKIIIWLVYVSLDTSVWILVSFTFERILSVFIPHKVKSYCTHMSSVLVIIGVVLAMMAVNGHILYGFETDVFQKSNTSVQDCTYVSKEYRLFFRSVFSWLDFSVYNCIPFCILIIGNSCISFSVVRSRRKTRKVAAVNTVHGPELAPNNTNTKRSFIASKRRERTSSMTSILLILNSVFLITTTPVSIYFIVMPKLQYEKSLHNEAVVTLVYTTVNVIMYINNAVNFILYCVTGSRFRKELFSIFKKRHTRVHERSARGGQGEEAAGTAPAFNRPVQGTQTSEVPDTVSQLPG